MVCWTDLKVSGDGFPEVGEEGIKQLLDVVVNGGLHWQSRHCHTVNMDHTAMKSITTCSIHACTQPQQMTLCPCMLVGTIIYTCEVSMVYFIEAMTILKL